MGIEELVYADSYRRNDLGFPPVTSRFMRGIPDARDKIYHY